MVQIHTQAFKKDLILTDTAVSAFFFIKPVAQLLKLGLGWGHPVHSRNIILDNSQL